MVPDPEVNRLFIIMVPDPVIIEKCSTGILPVSLAGALASRRQFKCIILPVSCPPLRFVGSQARKGCSFLFFDLAFTARLGA